LNPEIAACWKFVWNVEPAALMVPLTAAALDDPPAAGVDAAEDPVAAGVDVLEDEFDEHAAMASTAMAAPPAAMACLLPRSCMWGFSL
jgi:hypothetical protein